MRDRRSRSSPARASSRSPSERLPDPSLPPVHLPPGTASNGPRGILRRNHGARMFHPPHSRLGLSMTRPDRAHPRHGSVACTAVQARHESAALSTIHQPPTGPTEPALVLAICTAVHIIGYRRPRTGGIPPAGPFRRDPSPQLRQRPAGWPTGPASPAPPFRAPSPPAPAFRPRPGSGCCRRRRRWATTSTTWPAA